MISLAHELFMSEHYPVTLNTLVHPQLWHKELLPPYVSKQGNVIGLVSVYVYTVCVYVYKKNCKPGI